MSGKLPVQSKGSPNAKELLPAWLKPKSWPHSWTATMTGAFSLWVSQPLHLALDAERSCTRGRSCRPCTLLRSSCRSRIPQPRGTAPEKCSRSPHSGPWGRVPDDRGDDRVVDVELPEAHVSEGLLDTREDLVGEVVWGGRPLRPRSRDVSPSTQSMTTTRTFLVPVVPTCDGFCFVNCPKIASLTAMPTIHAERLGPPSAPSAWWSGQQLLWLTHMALQ